MPKNTSRSGRRSPTRSDSAPQPPASLGRADPSADKGSDTAPAEPSSAYEGVAARTLAMMDTFKDSPVGYYFSIAEGFLPAWYTPEGRAPLLAQTPLPLFTHTSVASQTSVLAYDEPVSGARRGAADTLAILTGCRHIIKQIITFADRPTQAACLTVNREWHAIAGKALYHSITLSDEHAPHSAKSSAWGVLRGALIGTLLGHVAIAGVMAHTCYGEPMCGMLSVMGSPSPERRSTLEEAIESINAGGWRARVASHLAETKDGEPCDRRNLEVLALLTLAIDIVSGSVDGKNIHYATNFKRALLQHVRVLTLATHDYCFCATFKDIIGGLMPNVEVIRFAGNHRHHELHWCFGNWAQGGHARYEPCDLITSFKPRQVVFRNVSPVGLRLGPWMFESVIDLVVMLPPTGADWWRTEQSTPELFFRDQLPNVRRLKIVFHDAHEDVAYVDPATQRTPALPESIILCLTSALPSDICFMSGDCPCPSPKACDITSAQAKALNNVDISVYGLGRVRFAKAGLAAALVADHGPDVSARAFLQLVKQDVITRKCLSEVVLQIEPVIPSKAYREAVTDSLRYLPMSEYIGDQASRRYELDPDE